MNNTNNTSNAVCIGILKAVGILILAGWTVFVVGIFGYALYDLKEQRAAQLEQLERTRIHPLDAEVFLRSVSGEDAANQPNK